MEKLQTKPGTPNNVPSRTVIGSWLKSLFPELPVSPKIEDFGDGVIYCRLLNHFYASPPHAKITWAPKNEYEFANNLRHAQSALLHLGITISFDVGRVSKRRFLQNWALINAFYRHFHSEGTQNHITQDNAVSIHQTQIGKQSLQKLPQNLNKETQDAQNLRVNGGIDRGLKRAVSNSFYPQFEQNVPLRVSTNYQNLPQQNIWDQNMQSNFMNMANQSLQIPQFLKENMNFFNSSPAKGKWSVGSQMFQNNHNAVVDRVKEILLKPSHDTEKVRQIKMLLGMPLEEEEVIKIEDDEIGGMIVHNFAAETVLQPDRVLQPERTLEKELSEIKEAHTHQKVIEQKDGKASLSKTPRKPFKF